MPPFVPPEPPIEPDAPTPPPELNVPLPPPEVGFGSPWAPADAENRDRILDWWRAWWRRVFFPWIAAWIAYWAAQWARIIAYLNEWLGYAGEYIEDHAVNGHSWWKTETTINRGGETVVEIVPADEFRPLLVGDLVSDTSIDVAFGQITLVIDATHAIVEYIGDLRGLTGLSWWTTETPINASGTTDVILPSYPGRHPQIGDLVSDNSSSLRFGQVIAVTDDTHVTVTPLGVLRGLAGFGWYTTDDDIAHTGTTDVVLLSGPPRPPQLNDLVVDNSASSAFGEIVAIADDTHVTVAFVNTLQGPQGIQGIQGIQGEVGPIGPEGPQGPDGIASLGVFDVSTGVLAPEGVYQAEMAGQPNMVGSFVIVTDYPAWVRVYASEAYMLADAARDILTPLNIADDHGCYLDFVSISAELSKTLTPGIMFTDIGDGLWLSVQNTDPDDPLDISVHFDYRIFRE
jgi:hypothetical protein